MVGGTKGDVHTGDGIERAEVSTDSLLTPDGGEGGSVLQALGSKEERVKRRKNKKESYAEYLESPTWRKIRAQALKRDKNKCRACGEKAVHVHHVRYPKNLGEEKMEWLYSLCAPCHNSIHRAAATMTLRAATDLILDASREENVTRFPDDWRLSKSATRARQSSKRVAQVQAQSRRKKRKAKLKPKERKKSKIELENERLRLIFKENRERRERRWGA